MQCFPEVVDADVSVFVLVKLSEDLPVLLGLLVGEADVHIPHLRSRLVAHRLQERARHCQLVLEGRGEYEGRIEGVSRCRVGGMGMKDLH